MKKILSLLLAAGVSVSLFAADILDYVSINGDVRSYTKTDFSIASKFGNYFRTPSVKFSYIIDSEGREIASSELTAKDDIINSIASSYDNNGNLTTQVCTTKDGESIWRKEIKYKNNKKTELAEYDSKNSLTGKTFFEYDENGNLVDETGYDKDGALIWKNIYKYNADNKVESLSRYSADGSLANKEEYSYGDNGNVVSITYFDNLAAKTSEEIFRYNPDDSLNEITTYDANKKINKRVVIKYDDEGNPNKVSEWTVSQKFGTTVNELTAQYEYDYNYSNSVPVQVDIDISAK